MQRRMSRCRLSSPCRRGESTAGSEVSGSANVTKKSFRSSRRLSNQHRSEKEYSSRALKGHPSCSPRRRFVACPRRPLLAIAAADLSIAVGLCASVPTSAHSIRSPPRVWRRYSRDSSLLYRSPSQLRLRLGNSWRKRSQKSLPRIFHSVNTAQAGTILKSRHPSRFKEVQEG